MDATPLRHSRIPLGAEESETLRTLPGECTRSPVSGDRRTGGAMRLATLGSPVPERAQTDGMLWIPGGSFRMGSDRHYPEEAPAHEVTIDNFWMDPAPVTNHEFLQFVRATGYVT